MSTSLSRVVADPDARATLKDYKSDADPFRMGPGYWHRLHRLAWDARTRATQTAFCAEMRLTCETFPCEVCRGHCGAYVAAHPPEQYVGKEVMLDGASEPLGVFVWLWQFHNAVNARLGKPLMSFITAADLQQSKTTPCSAACALADHAPFVEITPAPQKKKTYKKLKLVSRH